MKRSGRSVAEARRVIEIDEVLEAMIASGFSERTELGENLALDLLILGRGLDDEVAVGEILEASRRSLMRASAGACARLRVIWLRARPGAGQVAVDRGDRRLDALLGNVVHARRRSRQRADLRDAVAHLARADDADFANFDASCFPNSVIAVGS